MEFPDWAQVKKKQKTKNKHYYIEMSRIYQGNFQC